MRIPSLKWMQRPQPEGPRGYQAGVAGCARQEQSRWHGEDRGPFPTSDASRFHLGISGYCASAEEVGGDFCEVLQVAPRAVLLVVADAMGKGASAAGLATRLRALVRALAECAAQPGELLAAINRLMYGALAEQGAFITAQLVLVDWAAGRLTVASAGHCPLLLATADGQARAISPEGMPLGILPGQVFAEETLPLDRLCGVLLYSDGVTEARNGQGEFLGQAFLHHWLRQNTARRQPAKALAGNLISELRRFQSGAKPSDDQTFLLLTAGPADELSEAAECLRSGPKTVRGCNREATRNGTLLNSPPPTATAE